jgi:uncharacterized phage-associated protein
MANLTSQQVADYFLGTFDQDAGDNISPLKLQKLLYYAQGFHLAMSGDRPLFSDPLKAWDHGPVVVSIYHRYESYVWRAIDPPTDFDRLNYPPEVREILDAVNLVYGPFSAKTLERRTHLEPPWKNTRKNATITHDRLVDFFASLVEEGRSNPAVWPTNSFRYQRRVEIAEMVAPRLSDMKARARARAASLKS